MASALAPSLDMTSAPFQFQVAISAPDHLRSLTLVWPNTGSLLQLQCLLGLQLWLWLGSRLLLCLQPHVGLWLHLQWHLWL